MLKKNFSQKKFQTKFDGYYVSEDGRVFTEWHRKYIKGLTGCFSERGDLREINQSPRGGSDPKDRYMSVNISIKDETGKNIKQIKYYTHRLVAETLVKNPNNYSEIDHIDRDKKNNCVDNLVWVSRHQNMSKDCAKSYTITDILTGKTWKGTNLSQWVRENYNLINARTKRKDRSIKSLSRDLSNSRYKKTKIWNFIVEF